MMSSIGRTLATFMRVTMAVNSRITNDTSASGSAFRGQPDRAVGAAFITSSFCGLKGGILADKSVQRRQIGRHAHEWTDAHDLAVADATGDGEPHDWRAAVVSPTGGRLVGLRVPESRSTAPRSALSTRSGKAAKWASPSSDEKRRHP